MPNSLEPKDSPEPVRVLATRPEAQNQGWCELLARAGIATVAVPVLAIEPVQEPVRRQALKNLILDFDHFQKVVFVSQNAVRETFTWLDDYWPQLPSGIEYFAVGQKTAEALQERGVAAISCHYSMDSEELLELTQLQQVQGQKILICRGCGGRPHLAVTLESRGARVTFGEFYHRKLPLEAAAKLQQSDFGRSGYRDILAAFSGESLNNLVAVLEAAQIPQWLTIPLVVPGERVAQLARELGFRRVITAVNATDSAMLEALQQWLQGPA